MTEAETILWSRLRREQLEGARFRRQHPIGPYVADFACAPAKLVVEVDGETHWRPHEVARDVERTRFMEKRGWCVMRVQNPDIYRNFDGVLEAIRDVLIESFRGERKRFAPPPAGELPRRQAGAEGGRDSDPPSDLRGLTPAPATSPARGGGKPHSDRRDSKGTPP
jgi:very-short-patch-repair endonuclease